ncbi:MAG TPA: cellulose binding domain-containing protein, partial [Ktedonobacteraceae bacterium]
AYMLLTGHVPFPDHSRTVIVRKHRGEPPQPLSAYDSHIPAHIEAAVLRALAKQSAQRHASIQDFLDALAASTSQTRSFPVVGLSSTQKQAAPVAVRSNTPRLTTKVAAPGNTPRLTAKVAALGNTQKQVAPVAALGNTSKQAAPVAAFGNTKKAAAQELYSQPQSGTSLRSFMTKPQGTKKRKWPLIVGLGALVLVVALIAMIMNATAIVGGQTKTPVTTQPPTRVATSHQPTPTVPPVPIAAAPTQVAPPVMIAPTSVPVTRSCRIGYQTTNQGTVGIGGVGSLSGFSADVTITNTSSVAFTNWRLVFSYTQGQQIFTSPDSNPTQNGTQVIVTDDGTNPTIAAGQSVTITLVGGWNGNSNPSPRTFTLSNILCQ